MLEDYNKMFDQRYSISTYQLYKKDIASRLAHKNHYMSIENDETKILDLLIVVNQMLTGYDSKWINTLYLDKILIQESIVQAFSRTNRLFGYEKPFGNIKYYRKPFTMKNNIEEAFRTYSGDKPFGIFVEKLPKNLININRAFNEIKEVFYANNIFNFETNPKDEDSKKKFASKFKELNNYLESSKIQGFEWEKLEYKFDDPKDKIVVELDEQTYLILVIRYRELFSRSGGVINTNTPYQLESYLTEINTEHIDNEYMNSRFIKYVDELKNNDKELIEKTLNDLHKSFASLTIEEQKYAELFLYDVQTNKIELDSSKTFKDYVIEYINEAKRNRISMFCNAFGINYQLFEQFLSNFNKANPNEFGNFDNLKRSIDYNKAKEYLETKEKTRLSLFNVRVKVDEFIHKFINDEDFEF